MSTTFTTYLPGTSLGPSAPLPSQAPVGLPAGALSRAPVGSSNTHQSPSGSFGSPSFPVLMVSLTPPSFPAPMGSLVPPSFLGPGGSPIIPDPGGSFGSLIIPGPGGPTVTQWTTISACELPITNNEYRSGTVNSNTVNSKFHLIRSCCEYLARFLSFHV